MKQKKHGQMIFIQFTKIHTKQIKQLLYAQNANISSHRLGKKLLQQVDLLLDGNLGRAADHRVLLDAVLVVPEGAHRFVKVRTDVLQVLQRELVDRDLDLLGEGDHLAADVVRLPEGDSAADQVVGLGS